MLWVTLNGHYCHPTATVTNINFFNGLLIFKQHNSCQTHRQEERLSHYTNGKGSNYYAIVTYKGRTMERQLENAFNSTRFGWKTHKISTRKTYK